MEKQKKYLQLKDIDSYVLSFELSNVVWNIILKWQYFEKRSIGMQFARAMDSISANIAEGFGRYHKKDKIKFYRYAMASLYECFDWNEKSYRRRLFQKEDYDHVLKKLIMIRKELYALINYTNEKLKF